MSKQNTILLMPLAFCLLMQVVGCADNGTSEETSSEPTVKVDPQGDFFDQTKGEVAERLEAISGWLDENKDFPKSLGKRPSLSRKKSFVVAADSVDSFIWWIKSYSGGMMPLKHVDAVYSETFYSGEKIENYRLARDSRSMRRTSIGIWPAGASSLDELKQYHTGIMGSHVILTRKRLLEEIVVNESEDSDEFTYSGGPVQCEILVLDIDSMRAIFATSFEIKGPETVEVGSAYGRKLKTLKDRVDYSFHRAANKEIEKRISQFF